MPYLHLPFQAGSDRILAAMNRKHTARGLSGARRARSRRATRSRPSTDIIVGFPGETDADFAATLDVVRARSASLRPISFKYSPRPGTPAATLGGQVPEPVKLERLASAAGADRATANSVQRALRRQDHAGPVRACRAPPGPAGRPLALSASCSRRCSPPFWGGSCRLRSPAPGANSLAGQSQPRNALSPDVWSRREFC